MRVGVARLGVILGAVARCGYFTLPLQYNIDPLLGDSLGNPLEYGLCLLAFEIDEISTWRKMTQKKHL